MLSLLILSIVYVLGVAALLDTGGSVAVELKTNEWKIPFYLQLLESIAAIDDSLYAKAVYALSTAETDDEFLGDVQNDQWVYEVVRDAVGLSKIDQALVDLRVASKFYSLRIQSQYFHYENTTVPELWKMVSERCQYDSFGSKIERHGSLFSWLLAKDRLYCSPDDLFALQLTRKSDLLDKLQPFDRVIGKNENTPLLILYGDLEDEGFKSMFNNLYQSADVGKLRFIWRYAPIAGRAERLPNYGTTLTFKDSSYLSKLVGDKRPISADNAKQLGLKLASRVLKSKSRAGDKFELLKTTLNDLPSEISSLASVEVDKILKESAAANERMGISDEINGIYLNGAVVNDLELDSFRLMSRIEEELAIIREIMDLGFNLDQARTLITKFALYTSVKLNNFDDGSDDENRYKVFEHKFVPGSEIQRGGIVYVNDIEYDENYEDFESDRLKTYLDPEYQASSSKIPPLKENIHDIVFVINFSDKKQLKLLFTMSKLILDNAIPQQIGIMPIINSHLDKVITDYFYFIVNTSSPVEALAFLYKVFMRESDDGLLEIFEKVPIGDFEFDNLINNKILDKFSITGSSVIVNGKIFDMKTEWRDKMALQLVKDIQSLQRGLSMGDIGLSMKHYLYKSAKSERNLEIVPSDSSQLKYKKVTEELIRMATDFSYETESKHDIEMFIVGNLASAETKKQLTNILELMKVSSYNIQVRVIDSSDSGILNQLKQGILNQDSINSNIDKLKQKKTKEASLDLEMQKFLSNQNLPPHHSFILVNSRYMRIDKPLGVKDLETVISFEQSMRLSLVETIMLKYPDIFNGKSLEDFYERNDELSYHDWQDLFFTRLTKSFHIDDVLYQTDVSRYDFSSMNILNSFVISNSGEPLVDIFIIIDPLLPSSQHSINVVSSFIKLPFVRTRILLQPKQEYETLPITRFHRGLYAEYPLKFDEKGYFADSKSISFDNVPSNDVLTLDLVVPNRWKVASKYAKTNFDSDNIQFSKYEEKEQTIVYQLTSVLVEGYSKVVTTASLPDNLYFRAGKGIQELNTPVMGTLGYFQIPTDFGTWTLSTDGDYDILSASHNAFDYNREVVNHVDINVYTLDGLVLKPRLSSLGTSKTPIISQKTEEINIFAVATGHLYEKLMTMMMKTITMNTKSSIKFWILKDYLSPKFQQLLPTLARELNVEYELVSYKWPIWLRKQNLRQRTIWGYKILFLDALFPKDLDQIIFVDADQINRSDMQELVDLDMGEAPYGFVPMCESKEDMNGYMFWKEGYWKSTLKDTYKYHISALYKVNLNRFRQMKAADELRHQYQRLSAVPGSLSNLDQDLPNSFQRVLPIYSLPQDYLWCDTWCSASSKNTAKNIDLCNNPKTKENKIDTAKRVIGEWEDIENQVVSIENLVDFIERDPVEDLTSLTDAQDFDVQFDIQSDSEWEHDEL